MVGNDLRVHVHKSLINVFQLNSCVRLAQVNGSFDVGVRLFGVLQIGDPLEI